MPTQDFSTLPAAISGNATAGVSLDSTIGNPLPCLRSDGSGEGWIYDDLDWRVDLSDNGWEYRVDLYWPAAGRDIADIMFFSSVGRAFGFAVRLETGGSMLWLKITDGSHSSLGVADSFTASVGVWYQVILTNDGSNTVAMEVRVKSTSALVASGSIDLTAQLTGSHTKSGYFGQHPDGAGSATGHRYDNLQLDRIRASTGSAAFNPYKSAFYRG